MQLLPKWALVNKFPAIHDFESLTVLDQTARIYGAMNQMIEEYNKFADTVNDQISTFTGSEKEAREEFETKITKVMREFICSIEQKYSDLTALAATMINEAIQSGDITITEVYDPETESLNMVVGGEA